MNNNTESIKFILLKLESPATIYHSHDPLSLSWIDRCPVERGLPPWDFNPDFLANTNSEILVGLSCFVPDYAHVYVEKLCSHYDNSVIRYNSPSSRFNRTPYQDDIEHYVEVIWTDTEADKWCMAQLSGEDCSAPQFLDTAQLNANIVQERMAR